MSGLSISIVLYRTPLDMLSKCLLHYRLACQRLPATFNVDIILVNNSHQMDGFAIQQWLEQEAVGMPLRYIASTKNGGYGYGHNLAIAQSQADYHLVSNADIYVDEYALLEAHQYLENHTEVGLLSPDVVDLDNKRCYLCKKNPTLTTAVLRRLPAFLMNNLFKRILNDFENRHLDYNQVIMDYGFPTGCWMFFRMSVLKKLKGFDEGYFLYCEDADIGRRLKKIAHLAYVPTVKCCHVWQRASQRSWRLLLIHFYSIVRYQWKFRHALD